MAYPTVVAETRIKHPNNGLQSCHIFLFVSLFVLFLHDIYISPHFANTDF